MLLVLDVQHFTLALGQECTLLVCAIAMENGVVWIILVVQ